MTTNNLLRLGAELLEHHVPDPTLEARVLLSDALHIAQVDLLTHPDQEVAAMGEHDYRNLLTQRALGIPLAYVRGKQEFIGREFIVEPGVLIPRPATELLVQTILEGFPNVPMQMVDIGSGSGCIACSLALARPEWKIIALDPSPIARHVTSKNVEKFGLENRITVQDGFLLQHFNQSVDIIVANLPYLRTDQLAEPSISHEPTLALDGGADGFLLIDELLKEISQRPKPKALILECDTSQAETLANKCSAFFQNATVQVISETPTPVGVGVWWKN